MHSSNHNCHYSCWRLTCYWMVCGGESVHLRLCAVHCVTATEKDSFRLACGSNIVYESNWLMLDAFFIFFLWLLQYLLTFQIGQWALISAKRDAPNKHSPNPRLWISYRQLTVQLWPRRAANKLYIVRWEAQLKSGASDMMSEQLSYIKNRSNRRASWRRDKKKKKKKTWFVHLLNLKGREDWQWSFCFSGCT